MKIAILLHSTTGNTRIVTRFAAAYLRSRGHLCEVIDVVARPERPDLSGVDLIGVASPTMYLRPTFTIERYVSRMPNAEGGRKPAFLINSCGGMPGAQFAMLAELLAYKGYVTFGAYSVLAPSNWPPHVNIVRKIAFTEPLSMVAAFTPRSYRWFWALFWESICHPDERDRDGLVVFLDEMVQSATEGNFEQAPSPNQLDVPIPTTDSLGRIVWRDLPDNFLQVHIDRQLCSRCGTCINVCSDHVITRVEDDDVPTVGTGCTGCYACFNKCPEGAISDNLTSPGVGQYRRPPESMRDLFRWPR